MIGIIGAMNVEIEKLQAEIQNPVKKQVSGITYVSGTIHSQDVVIAVCGIGKVFAGVCAQTMILEYQPNQIINIGVGGTLTKELTIGDIAVANAMVQHDMDTSPIGDPIGLISGINLIELPCDEGIVTKLRECLKAHKVNSVVGTIASGDQFIANDSQRSFISKQFGAIACEMEGAAIAQVCYINKVPCGVIRSISDSADHSAEMDYPSFVKMACERSFALIMDYLKKA